MWGGGAEQVEGVGVGEGGWGSMLMPVYGEISTVIQSVLLFSGRSTDFAVVLQTSSLGCEVRASFRSRV